MKRFTIFALSSVLLLLSTTSYAKGQQVEQELKVPANVRVVIDLMRGKVDIRGGDANTAKVAGTVDKHAEKFVFELNGDTLTIKTEMPKRGNYNNDDGNDLTISLPATARVEAKSVSADFKARDFKGHVSMNTVSGNIIAERLTGGARLESVSGDVIGKKLAGELLLHSVSGDIEDANSDSPRATYTTVSGDVKATTNAIVVRAESVSGDVELDLQAIDSLHVNNVSGDVEVAVRVNPQARVNAETVSGDVEMRFAGEVHADIDAKVSSGGGIHNHLTQQVSEKSKYGVGEKLQLQLGERSGSMRFGSVSGDIILRSQ